MTTVDIETRAIVLDQPACWDLLATSEVGRLGYIERAMPVIRPVPFAVHAMAVVVALGASTLRPALWTHPAVVAFEADEWHPQERWGWTVHTVGRAALIVEPSDVTEIGILGLAAWIDAQPARYLRISPEVMSGRRVEPV